MFQVFFLEKVGMLTHSQLREFFALFFIVNLLFLTCFVYFNANITAGRPTSKTPREVLQRLNESYLPL